MADNTEITAPVAKAVTALGAGAASSVLTVSQQAQSFYPTTLSEWLACAAAAFSVIYTLSLLCSFYWKKVWRPLLERWGYIKPSHRGDNPRISGDAMDSESAELG